MWGLRSFGCVVVIFFICLELCCLGFCLSLVGGGKCWECLVGGGGFGFCFLFVSLGLVIVWLFFGIFGFLGVGLIWVGLVLGSFNFGFGFVLNLK